MCCMQPEAFAIEWLRKARNDLPAAEAILDSAHGITDVPCFHAQQCVEKSFKALLTAIRVTCANPAKAKRGAFLSPPTKF